MSPFVEFHFPKRNLEGRKQEMLRKSKQAESKRKQPAGFQQRTLV
jgi:hypothetical protein